MGDYAAEMLFAILRQSFSLVYNSVRLVGGLVIGHWRTHENTKGYQPKHFGVPLKSLPPNLVSYCVALPEDTPWDADRALRFVSQVIALGRCVLQIEATSNNIAFSVTFLDGIQSQQVLSALVAHYPEGNIETPAYLQARTLFPFTRASVFLVPEVMFSAPIFTADLVKHFDPLVTLTEAMSHLQKGERITFSIAVLDQAIGAAEVGFKQITLSDIHPLAYTDLEGIAIAEIRKSKGFDRFPKFEGNIQSVLEDKLQHPLYHCLTFLQTEAQTNARAQDLLTMVVPHIDLFANPPFNGLTIPSLIPHQSPTIQVNSIPTPNDLLVGDISLYLYQWLNPDDAKTNLRDRDLWKRCLCVYMPEEITALWHLPHVGFTSPLITRLTSKHVPAPMAVRNIQKGVFIGYNRYGQTRTKVYLPADADERTTHALVIGKTGTGKSSLLHSMVHTDVQRYGVCVIDPHGKLVQRILQNSIPVSRIQDVVILDLANEVDGVHYPPPFNFLAKPNAVNGEVAAGMVMSVLTKIYEGFGEMEIADTLSMALETLGYATNPTLLDVPRLFDDADFRNSLISKVENISVRRFWKSFLSKSGNEQDRMLYPMLRRLNGFYRNNALLAMTCHPEPINLVELMRQNKIILISLGADETKIPDREQKLIGSMLVSQLQMAAMAGAIRQSPFLLYIDEAEHFVTTALSTMLSQVRKYGLGMVIANQYLQQLAGDTLDAVMGTVGTLISFEVGEPDARAVAVYMKPQFEADDLISLGKYRAAVSLRVNGTRQNAFSLETPLPPEDKDVNKAKGRESYLRRQSVANYTPKPYHEVIKWLHQRYEPEDSQQPDHNQRGNDDEFIEPKP